MPTMHEYGTAPPFDPRDATAVSGTREEADAFLRRGLIERGIWSIPAYGALVTGACTGVDGWAARIGKRRGVHVHTIVPFDQGRLVPDWLEHCDTYEIMPIGSTLGERDQRMIDIVWHLLAYPLYGESDPRMLRSGTWKTIRMARRKGIRPEIVTLR